MVPRAANDLTLILSCFRACWGSNWRQFLLGGCPYGQLRHNWAWAWSLSSLASPCCMANLVNCSKGGQRSNIENLVFVGVFELLLWQPITHSGIQGCCVCKMFCWIIQLSAHVILQCSFVRWSGPFFYISDFPRARWWSTVNSWLLWIRWCSYFLFLVVQFLVCSNSSRCLPVLQCPWVSGSYVSFSAGVSLVICVGNTCCRAPVMNRVF